MRHLKYTILFLLFIVLAIPVSAGIDFTGSENERANCGCSTNTDISGDYTWYIVMEMDASQESFAGVWVKNNTCAGTNTNIAMQQNGTSGNIIWYHDNSNNTDIGADFSDFDVPKALVITWVDSSNAIQAWLDGTQILDTTETASPNASSNGQIKLASNRSDFSDISGTIYESALWTSALSDSDASALSSSRVKGIARNYSPSTLVAHWLLDDHPEATGGDGLVFIDQIGNHDCTGDEGDAGGGIDVIAERRGSYQ